MAALKIKKRSGIGLYRKLASIVLILEVVAVIAFGCVLVYVNYNVRANERQQTLLNSVESTATTYGNYFNPEGFDEKPYPGVCRTLKNSVETNNTDAFVTDLDGNVAFCATMADSDYSAYGVCKRHTSLKIPRSICDQIIAEGSISVRGDLDGRLESDSFISAAVIKTDGAPCAIIFKIQSIDIGLKAPTLKFLRIYLLSALAMVVSSVLIVYFSIYNMTKPFRQMIEATKRYAKGDFSYKIDYDDDVKHIREFYDLSVALDTMSSDLEALENSRSNFVANVSHEMKTPMTTIGGFIDGILDGTIDYEHQNYYLKIVSDEVKRLSRLVVSMLNISKIEAGELRIAPVKFDISDLITNIFIGFEQKIEQKQITVNGFEYLRAVYVEADKDMINQVFYNLIDNAVKFAEIGGEIAVEMSSDDEYVTTAIRNTGKVINEEDISHVFERFYKGDKSRSLDTKSVGLGLFIVKNIIELHGGEISVRTIDEKYTEFTVRLKTKLTDT